MAENGAYVTRVTTSQCQGGEVAIGGRAAWGNNANDLELFLSDAGLTGGNPPTAYYAMGGNDTGVDKTLYVTVYCLTP